MPPVRSSDPDPPAARPSRLAALRARLQAQLRPGTNLQLRSGRDAALLRTLSPAELQDFARDCGALVVTRLGGAEFEFTPAPRI